MVGLHPKGDVDLHRGNIDDRQCKKLCFAQLSEDKFQKMEENSRSVCPAEAMPWIGDIELAKSIDDLKTSQSIAGRVYFNFETLGGRIATASRTTMQGSSFNKSISLEEQKSQNEDRFFRGRQIACMIYSRDHP